MPLLIKRASAGRFSPRVYCDHCGQEIEDPKDGNYAFRLAILQGGQMQNVLREGETTDIYFTHKACQIPFEEANGGRGFWCAEGLTVLPALLASEAKKL